MRFWAAQTVSLAGAEITLLAVPLTAILVLNATPFQLGIISASTFLPFLLFSLVAGAIADRVRRVRLMVLCNLVRAAFLALIPAAAVFGLLRIELLYVIAFVVGTCTVFFALAYQSAIPDVAGREHLIEGNAKLEATRSLTQILGPSLAGVLVQALTAPIAIAVDVVSFLVSATLLRPLLKGETAPATPARRSLLREILEGLRWVYGERRLRTLALSTTTYNFATNMATTMYLLTATRQLGLEPLTIGIIASFGGPTVLLGALVTPSVTRRLGMGRTLIVANATSGLAFVIMGLAGSLPASIAVFVLAAAQALNGCTLAPFNVNQMSFRQSITPAHLLGRTNATMRFTNFGAIAIGALVGGALGTAFGPQAVVILGGSLAMLGSLWLVASPLRRQSTIGEALPRPTAAT
jgi:MFS family permease